MRALRFEQFGDPLTHLHLVEVQEPRLAPQEAIVQVKAAGLNPSDAKNVLGRMPQTRPPRIPGRDFAGTVLEGPEEWLFAEVFSGGGDLGFTRDGAHAERLLVPVDALLRRPDRLTVEQAAALGVPYVTAWLCLVEACRLQPGEQVLLLGGAGAVGQAAAQIARWMGARPSAAVRNPDALRPEVRELFDQVLPIAGLQQAAREATGGRGHDVVLGAVGGAALEAAIASLAHGGRAACIAPDPEQQHISIEVLPFYRRQLELHGVDSLGLSAVEAARVLRWMLPGFSSGALRPVQAESIALSAGPVAFAEVLAGHTRRSVLVP